LVILEEFIGTRIWTELFFFIMLLFANCLLCLPARGFKADEVLGRSLDGQSLAAPKLLIEKVLTNKNNISSGLLSFTYRLAGNVTIFEFLGIMTDC